MAPPARRILLLLLSMGLAAPAGAQRRDADPDSNAASEASSNRINVRLGGSSAGSSEYAVICVEGRPWKRLYIETCGTGAGLFRELRGTDVAHFRAKWGVYERSARGGYLRVQAGFGFAELEVAEDEPGFSFSRPSSPGVETAGPEASGSVQYLVPLGKGLEAIINVNAGLAWLPYAPDLIAPQDAWQPFLGFDVGAGW